MANKAQPSKAKLPTKYAKLEAAREAATAASFSLQPHPKLIGESQSYTL